MRYLLILGLLLAGTAFTSPTDPPEREDIIKEDLAYLTAFYQTRHQNPEISLKEKETAKVLAGELRKIGLEVTENFGGYGIVGIFKNGEGPTILYRTDMDALPMYEKTKLPYASLTSLEVCFKFLGAYLPLCLQRIAIFISDSDMNDIFHTIY